MASEKWERSIVEVPHPASYLCRTRARYERNAAGPDARPWARNRTKDGTHRPLGRKPGAVRNVVVGRSQSGTRRRLLSPQNDDGKGTTGLLLLPSPAGRNRHDVPVSADARCGPAVGRAHPGRVLFRCSRLVTPDREPDVTRLVVGGPAGRSSARD